CRDESRELLKLILRESHLSEDRSLNRTGTDGIHPNFALFEIRGPCSSKGTHSCLRGIVYTEATESFAPCNRRVQYDRAPILKQRQRFLHREKQSLHIDAKQLVKMFFADRAEGSQAAYTRICKQDVDVSTLFPYCSVKTIQVREACYIALDSQNVLAD